MPSAPMPKPRGSPGIDPRRTTFGVFVLMGALAGLAAVMNVVAVAAGPADLAAMASS